MNADTKHIFYSSKPRLIHVALNIALAPILLYLLGAWAWPPTLPHYVVFVLSGSMALNYARTRWAAPRLVLDAEGLFCGKFYPLGTIYKAEGTLRSVKLTILEDAKVKQKIVSLGWASAADYKAIVLLLGEHFQREIPDNS